MTAEPTPTLTSSCSRSVSAADDEAPPPPKSSRRTVRFRVELTCLSCGRDVGILESDAWPTYQAVLRPGAGAPSVEVTDWRRLRCATCGGAAMPDEITPSARPARIPDRLVEGAAPPRTAAKASCRRERRLIDGVMPQAPTTVAYHGGRCALCNLMLDGACAIQQVRLHVFGAAGTVILQCWLCPGCRPTRATLSSTTGDLLQRILGWYRSTPSAWPTPRLAEGA